MFLKVVIVLCGCKCRFIGGVFFKVLKKVWKVLGNKDFICCWKGSGSLIIGVVL